MSWTEEKQELPSISSLISENTALKQKLEEAKSIMNEQNSIITEQKNKQASLTEIEKKQEELQLREQKLEKKEMIYSELKADVAVNLDMSKRFKTDFHDLVSPAFNIISNSSKSLTGGVKGLKYTDLKEIHDILYKVREEAEKTQRYLRSSLETNQKLVDGGYDKFALKLRDAKLEHDLRLKIAKER